MNRLSELRKDLLDMTVEELRDKIRQIRNERRIVKERPSAKRKAKVKSNKSAARVVNMLHTLTPRELKLLLGEVEDGTEGSPGGQDKGEGPSTE
jgi:hypothetical protein